jgi:hypothetical protein
MQTPPKWIGELGEAVASVMPKGVDFALIVYAVEDPSVGYLVAALAPGDARMVLSHALKRLDEGPPDGAVGTKGEA